MLLTDDELRQVLSSPELVRFKEQMKKSSAGRLPAGNLVGRWIDLEVYGPGKVVSFLRVTNRLLYDSHHMVALSSGEERMSPRPFSMALLRRILPG